MDKNIGKAVQRAVQNKKYIKIIKDIAKREDKSYAVGEIFRYIIAFKEENGLETYLELLAENMKKNENRVKLNEVRDKYFSEKISEMIKKRKRKISQEELNEKVFDYMYKNIITYGYVVHAFNGTLRDSIEKYGINNDKKLWDDDSIERVEEILSKYGIEDTFGSYDTTPNSDICLTTNLSNVYDYAKSSPYWFAQFVCENWYTEYNKESIYNKDYSSAREVVDLILRQKNVKEADRAEVIKFFETNWKTFMVERFSPCCALVERESIEILKGMFLSYEKFKQITTAKTIDEKAVVSFVFSIIDNQDDIKIQTQIEPKNLIIIQMPEYKVEKKIVDIVKAEKGKLVKITGELLFGTINIKTNKMHKIKNKYKNRNIKVDSKIGAKANQKVDLKENKKEEKPLVLEIKATPMREIREIKEVKKEIVHKEFGEQVNIPKVEKTKTSEKQPSLDLEPQAGTISTLELKNITEKYMTARLDISKVKEELERQANETEKQATEPSIKEVKPVEIKNIKPVIQEEEREKLDLKSITEKYMTARLDISKVKEELERQALEKASSTEIPILAVDEVVEKVKAKALNPNTDTLDSEEKLRLEKLEKEKIEAKKLEVEKVKLEAERLEKEKLEAAKIEVETLEKARLEAEKQETKKQEKERLAAEKLKAETLEREKLEAKKLEKEKLEAEKLEAEKQEAERLEAERLEAIIEKDLAKTKAQIVQDKCKEESISSEFNEIKNEIEEKIQTQYEIEFAKILNNLMASDEPKEVNNSAEITDGLDDGNNLEIEENINKEKLEAERIEAETLEKTRLEAEKLEAENLEKERLEAEKLKIETLEKEKLEAEKLEKEKLEAEKLEAERLEKEKLEAERLEAERLEAEKLEAERLEKERLEAERLEKEKLEAERLEAERLEAERLEAERLEAERLEIARIEAEKLEAERLEIARIEAEKQEKARLEAEKLEAEKQEIARIEAKKNEAEKAEIERLLTIELESIEKVAMQVSKEIEEELINADKKLEYDPIEAYEHRLEEEQILRKNQIIEISNNMLENAIEDIKPEEYKIKTVILDEDDAKLIDNLTVDDDEIQVEAIVDDNIYNYETNENKVVEKVEISENIAQESKQNDINESLVTEIEFELNEEKEEVNSAVIQEQTDKPLEAESEIAEEEISKLLEQDELNMDCPEYIKNDEDEENYEYKVDENETSLAIINNTFAEKLRQIINQFTNILAIKPDATISRGECVNRTQKISTYGKYTDYKKRNKIDRVVNLMNDKPLKVKKSHHTKEYCRQVIRKEQESFIEDLYREINTKMYKMEKSRLYETIDQ